MSNGVGSAAASGALSGAGKGSKIGSTVGSIVGSVIPGVGTAIGGAAGGAIGAQVGAAAGGVSAAIKQKKANQAQQIPFVDPMEAKRLAELEQTRRSISSGTDVLTRQGIQEQQNIGRSTQGAISRATGGDVGQTIDALLKAQRGTQAGVNNVMSQSAQRLPYFDSAAGQLTDKMAQRKLELALLKRDQAVAENAQARKEANLNANALIATEGGVQTIPEYTNQFSQYIANGFGSQQNPIQSNNPTAVLGSPNAQLPNQGLVNVSPENFSAEDYYKMAFGNGKVPMLPQ